MTIVDRAEQAADYARAGFGQELQPGTRPALVVVDPARAYIDPDCPLYAGSRRTSRRCAPCSLLRAKPESRW